MTNQMRYREIVEGADWASRFAQFQKAQTKRTKLRRKLATATAKSYQNHRKAADTAARDHNRIADLKRDLAKP